MAHGQYPSDRNVRAPGARRHAAHAGGFMATVAITIAVLAAVAAAVGSLKAIESGGAVAAKNEAVLHQNRATDQWNFF